MTDDPTWKFHALTFALLVGGAALTFWTPPTGYWFGVSIIGSLLFLLGLWRWFVVALYDFANAMAETSETESGSQPRYGPRDQWEQKNLESKS